MSEVFWDGKGLPPVGCICEILPAYQKVKITYIGQNVGCYVDLLNGIEFSMTLSSVCFMPIKSAQNKTIEELGKKILEAGNIFVGGAAAKLIAEHLYDAGLRFTENKDAN